MTTNVTSTIETDDRLRRLAEGLADTRADLVASVRATGEVIQNLERVIESMIRDSERRDDR
jgi:hypothetical protein